VAKDAEALPTLPVSTALKGTDAPALAQLPATALLRPPPRPSRWPLPYSVLQQRQATLMMLMMMGRVSSGEMEMN
jgi:hypothetical protein